MSANTWKKPPLALVVAGLQYDKILGFETVLASFQELMRQTFPGYANETVQITQHTKIAQLSLSQNRQVFRSSDGTAALILGDQGLLLVTSRYQHHQNFIDSLLGPTISGLVDAVPHGPLFIRRYGLRYVDRIIPAAGETPEQYVSNKLRHDLNDLLPTKVKALTGVSYARLQMAHGSLDLRFFTGFGRPPLPSDLMPVPVTDDMPLESNNVDESVRTGVIDTDRFFETAEVMNKEGALAMFTQLHEDITSVFKAVITKHAMLKWGVPTNRGPK